MDLRAHLVLTRHLPYPFYLAVNPVQRRRGLDCSLKSFLCMAIFPFDLGYKLDSGVIMVFLYSLSRLPFAITCTNAILSVK